VRDIFQKDSERITTEGMNHLREAREYAHQQAEKREKQMPKLTPEQEEQMHQYLKMVGQHGHTKLSQITDEKECLGCPMLSKFPLRPPPAE
jgi:Ribonuclease G/E